MFLTPCSPRSAKPIGSFSPTCSRTEALTQTSEAERDPQLSPDNQYVSFRRGPDLYTVEVSSKIVFRLTANGSDTLLNGQLDWVYPEELDIDTANGGIKLRPVGVDVELAAPSGQIRLANGSLGFNALPTE